MPSPIEMMIDRASMVCTVCSKPAGTCDCWVKCECGVTNLRGKECRNQIWHISKQFAEEAADLIIADMAESYKMFQREHMAERLKRAVIRQTQPIMTEVFDGVEAAVKNRPTDTGERDVRRVEELKLVCAELYQVIGYLSGAHHDCFGHPDVQRALDNASQARLVHKDLLPFPKRMLYGEKRPKPKRRRAKRS